MPQSFVSGSGTQPQTVTVVQKQSPLQQQQQQQQMPQQQQQQPGIIQRRSHTPDMANRLAAMQTMAQRYLPSLDLAIEKLPKCPKFENLMIKYKYIRSILEKPEQNSVSDHLLYEWFENNLHVIQVKNGTAVSLADELSI